MPYVGEIRLFAGTFAPNGWAECAGQTIPISENDVLFNLIGTTYGGDGQETFMLPNLQGRVPLHMGRGPGVVQTYVIGQSGGAESISLTREQMAAHGHAQVANTRSATENLPAGNVLARSTKSDAYVPAGPFVPLHPAALDPSGGDQPHDNLQPYTVIRFIISLFGVFPHQ